VGLEEALPAFRMTGQLLVPQEHSKAVMCVIVPLYPGFKRFYFRTGRIQLCPDEPVDNRNFSGRINPTHLLHPDQFHLIIMTLRKVLSNYYYLI
jgi:hypothetical protein